MPEIGEKSVTCKPLLKRLEGTECTFCELGELVHETYNGNDAAVCPECGVPSAQVWSSEY